ncbi:hypothetical protein F2Q70_00028335 [Brassica cretica]|uniref:GBF-interacting protein 1 N-terminal domain-containing protein n=1 Tax=Brassica cretica TaxID=69181 RepID=A0A8S9L956_BRACR|nr:hypothetical protein F2Q70_00028335 [Brassica cretica]
MLEPQQEVLLPENPETAHPQNQYSFAQSDQEYAYENAKQQTNTAFDASQTSMQNQIASLTDVMQGYSNATPNTLLGQTAQSARELELQYSTFPGGQSMPSRSNDYSLNDQSISMPEALRDGGGTQTTQPSQQQNLPGANIATGPALPQGPQQLPMHPYSQHTVPLTHFANMISYPLMPQGYPYMPSAFQQAFSGNSSYHQSPAALLPQYKNNISPSSLPQSAPISSPYGFGNSSNVGAGNFSLNQQQQQQAAPTESQQEVLLPENPETAHPQNQYSFAQSDQEYAYENAKQQTNTAFDASQTSMHNQIASLTDVMQGYSNAAPNTLLGQTAQSARELELQYSTFPGGQSMSSRSNDYSLNDQSISMPETLRDGGGIQTTQPSQQQNIPGANIATGPALPQGPQQLPMHPYSQHTVPLTHFANMISYPLMPQGYPYMPSAFQQAFSGNSSYHQSPAALLPQYKNNISPSSLPQSAPISSPYGFGNSSNVGAGNFSLNQQQQQQAAPTVSTF